MRITSVGNTGFQQIGMLRPQKSKKVAALFVEVLFQAVTKQDFVLTMTTARRQFGDSYALGAILPWGGSRIILTQF